jgi:hypothetical protein
MQLDPKLALTPALSRRTGEGDVVPAPGTGEPNGKRSERMKSWFPAQEPERRSPTRRIRRSQIPWRRVGDRRSNRKFKGARRDKSSGESLLGEGAGVRAVVVLC